jgi:hypothetical protein
MPPLSLSSSARGGPDSRKRTRAKKRKSDREMSSMFMGDSGSRERAGMRCQVEAAIVKV